MIKGINKQIIEIKCTNDEYFDKVLLFVRADRAGTPQGILQKGADNFCGRLLPAYRGARGNKRCAAKIALLLMALAGLSAILIYLICQAF